MPSVKVKDDFEKALRTFKRSLEKSGILVELKKRDYYEKPSAKKKRMKATAIKRSLKRLAREKAMFEEIARDGRH